DREVLTPENCRRPGDKAAGDRRAHPAGAVEGDIGCRDVEDADETREVVAVELIRTGIWHSGLLRPRLKQHDALVMIAAEHVNVTSAVHRNAASGWDVHDDCPRIDRRCAARDIGAG